MKVFMNGCFFTSKVSSKPTMRNTRVARSRAPDVVDMGIYARRSLCLVVTLVSEKICVGAYIDIMCSLLPVSELW
jgi:hypothetical protein